MKAPTRLAVLMILLAPACDGEGSQRAHKRLSKAVFAGDATGTRRALENGADPERPVKGHVPALAAAAAEGHLEVAKVLIEAGAALDPRCHPQVICKPLPHAVENGHAELTRLLLTAGADPNGRNPYGDVPLMYALARDEIETAHILLENGADPNLTNQFDMSSFAGACAMGRFEFVVAALANGADLEATHAHADHEAVTPLMRAAAEGHREVVEVLLAAGADASAEATPFATAETFARDAGHDEIATLLASRRPVRD